MAQDSMQQLYTFVSTSCSEGASCPLMKPEIWKCDGHFLQYLTLVCILIISFGY